MKLPNVENAYIDMRKLTDYALDPAREEGGGKARVFETVLGIRQGDAEYLHDAIIGGVLVHDATATQKNPYGQKYEVQFEIMGLNERFANNLTVWIIRNDEDFPRLVTVYVV